MADAPTPLTPIERAALALSRFANERPAAKRAQMRFLRGFSQKWVKRTIHNRIYLSGMDKVVGLRPDRGVVMAANHRSFFDQYVIMLAMFESGVDWVDRMYFPVRANFFYEHPLGLLVNAGVGGMVMYPPIFRDIDRRDLNNDALDRIAAMLDTPGTLVGLHPEGTRGKGPDPYDLLPAQPGIGRIVLRSQPIVLPFFINGMSSDLLAETRLNYVEGIRREKPLIIVAGDPVDYSEFTQTKPRPALYKRCSDKIRADIAALMDTERDIRERCLRGDISDDDPGWMVERR